jgi:hypothetical protein
MESVMARRRWGDLDERTRRLIVAGGAVEGVLKAVALADLRRRPASEVRGRKLVWGLAIGLAGSAGTVPLAYLLFGRRRG